MPQTSVCQLRNSQRRPLSITEVVDRLSRARADDNTVTGGDLEGDVSPDAARKLPRPLWPRSASQCLSPILDWTGWICHAGQWKAVLGNGHREWRGSARGGQRGEDGEEDDGILKKKGTTSGLRLGLESCMEHLVFFWSEGE